MRALPWAEWMAPVAWLLLLVLLPWWLGLPLLLAAVALLLARPGWLQIHTRVLRLALRWGLPGVMLALKRWLGGDALAWTIAAVAALAGFTLLAGLEAWLDRDLPRAAVGDAGPTPDAWPERMLHSSPLAGEIVELVPVQWHDAPAELDDPRGGRLTCCSDADGFRGVVFDDGTRLAATAGRYAFSPGGRWFALDEGAATTLRDRDRNHTHRLHGRQLCGWHADQPWLQGGPTAMPEPLPGVLDSDEETPAR